jgi:Rieske 2Fe-2S family protein
VIPRTASDVDYLLPPTAYWSPSWFDHEQATLFAPRWALVASADELVEPGDYVTTVVGRAPLLVVRDDDGGLRAFHNLCRHRGMVLLEGSGNVARTVNCFYPQWRYGLDGSLQVVPQSKEQFPDLDRSTLGLREAALEIWEGMVFVHPDPHAAPLAETLGELPAHLGSHQPGRLHQVAHQRIEARCNWKLFVENHIDVYHLWYLHEQSLGDFDHRQFEHRQLGRNWASYEPLKGDQLAEAALTRQTVTIDHLDSRDRFGLGAHLVFPNLMMATAAEFFATYQAEPVAPDRTVIDLRIRAEQGADAAALLDALRSFITEDITACEAVQAAVGSPAFEVGPLAAEHEQPITTFHTNILDALGLEARP